ncbi:pyrroloquinoline quinone precursor peptide PqqA [Acinetobacter courvalinii]|uniref:Coenzyme PQQ synthesis protein A n=1 Tax=Acinetobacter colistiniresistens TaxID=280145 RepID=A0A558FFH5_9GAMM|nr:MULTISPECIES: pyrroloquinoline quinone precursor peptide PqqA [Acinetobacter]RSN80844.1 pyrroloquinoline quinone precursor peptide PqqA [Acinetobacter baumannii]EKU53154.1 coenzyme PQQ precursor peptide PqqA [Acinetobacter sp. WC-323]KAB0661921.1 pyrroloquinoline quinone precursor peptide PqqA [Acinetobacter courvalinii]MBJ8419160.1 pyrroloquinoline quinone precursor peptide PqqA [Acinetobacter courvalinii]MBJ8483522.1 pyrroloquinoline quinone precursor peptide PqqA [Acinetobacter vivianii]
MQWTKPAFTDVRIGFEVTMYFEVR